MIARRLQTRSIPEPPIKLYRRIALTFLIIAVALLGFVIFSVFKKSEITIMAKEDMKSVNFIVSAEKEKTNDKSIAAEVTTAEFFWSEKYYPTAVKETEGTSKGQAVIYNKTNETQILVKTTRLLTPEGVLFRLSDRVVIPAYGQTTANVYADQSGTGGDIGPKKFTIPGLSPERQKVVYAESSQPMSGGASKIGYISEADLKSAETDFAAKAEAAFLKTLSSNNSNFDKKIVSAKKVSLASSQPIGAETSAFVISGTSTMTAVTYNGKELADLANKEFNAKIDSGSEKILSASVEPKVEIASADAAKGEAQLAVTAEALVTLDANGSLLNKENFLGKKKSEIERYIVSLPHVTGMTVSFSPSWSSTAPTAVDKIKVTVKVEK